MDKLLSFSDVMSNLPILIGLAVTFGFATALGLWRATREGIMGMLVLLGLVVPVLMAFVASIVLHQGLATAKYLTGASVFFFLLLGLACVQRRTPKAGLCLLVIVLAFNLYSQFNYQFRDTEFGRKMNWRGLAQYVMGRSRANDIVGTAGPPAFEWYYQGNLPVHCFTCSSLNASPEAETERVAQTLGSHPRVWYAEITRCNPDSAQALALRWLQSNYVEVEEVRFNPLLVLHLFQRQEP